MKNMLVLLAGLLLSLSCMADPAAEDTSLPIRFNGFGTLGVAKSDISSAEFVRDLSQPRGVTKKRSGNLDSVLGLQATLALATDTDAVVQVISRYHYDRSYTPEIAWAFLRHDFSPEFQIRLGRLGTEFYMLGDSRLIGYSNLMIRPPADFYGLLVFNYFDGVDFTAKTAVGDGLLRGKVFLGRSPETTPFVPPMTWDLEGTRVLGGHLDYFLGAWQFRIAHSQFRFSSTEAPFNALFNAGIAANPTLASLLGSTLPLDITGLFPESRMANTTSRFDSLGAIYDRGPLQVQVMLGRIAHQTESYEDTRAGFMTAAYRIGAFTPYVGYSRAKSKATSVSTVPPVPLGPLLNQLVTLSLSPNSHIDRHTTSLGVRWDFAHNWAFKTQLDAIRGSSQSISAFRAGPWTQPYWEGRMNIFSATLDFAF